MCLGSRRLAPAVAHRMSEIGDLRREYVRNDCTEFSDAGTGADIVPLGPDAHAVPSELPREEGNPWVIADKLPGSRT